MNASPSLSLSLSLSLTLPVRYMRKNFRCNGAVVKSKTGEEIILLQGNQGDNVISFMVDMNICKREQVIRKGI